MRCLISLGTDNMIKLWDMKRFKCFAEIAPSVAATAARSSSASSSIGTSIGGSGYGKVSASQYVSGTFTKAVWCGAQSFVVGSSTGVIRLYESGGGNSGSSSNAASSSSSSGGGGSESISMMSSGGVNPSSTPLDASPSLPTSSTYTASSGGDWVGRDLSVHTSCCNNNNQSQVTAAACTDLICAMNTNNNNNNSNNSMNILASGSKSGQIFSWVW